ncbi:MULTISPECIES: hypothetical protein [unclassified Streptomyces]|uniref:hypothetical protein n=1 Tax=unclassified Streptomyces TaxID=2593676 RepID=UPI0040436764
MADHDRVDDGAFGHAHVPHPAGGHIGHVEDERDQAGGAERGTGEGPGPAEADAGSADSDGDRHAVSGEHHALRTECVEHDQAVFHVRVGALEDADEADPGAR